MLSRIFPYVYISLVIFFQFQCGSIAGLSDSKEKAKKNQNNLFFALAGIRGGDSTSPAIIKTYPASGDIEVTRNPEVTVEFSEEMDPNSITNTNVFIVGVSSLVQYSGKIARLTPTTLEANKEYTLIVSPSVKDSAGNGLTAESKISFTTGTGTNPDGSDTTPVVSSIFPTNGATSVSLNSSMAVTFSKEINPGTLSNSSFQLWNGSTQVLTNTTTVGKYGGAMYPLSVLSPNTTYTIKITTSVTDNSNPPKSMASEYSSTFTTGNSSSTNISILGTSPAHASNQVPVGTKIIISADRELNSASVTTANVQLSNSGAVAGTVSMLGTDAFVFTPSNPLPVNTVHTFTITTAVQDTGTPANSLASNYSINFTTGASIIDPAQPTVTSINPANAATGISINPTIMIQFSEPMNSTSINTTNITLMQGVTPITCTVQSVGDSVAALIPSSPLSYNTAYTVTVGTGVTDMSSPATNMAAPYMSTFTTTTPPTLSVTGITPANGATSVATNTSISVTFSSNVNAATLNSTNITLTELPATNISGTITPVGTNSVLFIPSNSLNLSQTYSFQISTGVTDTYGNALSSTYTAVFSTSSSNPDSGSVTTIAGATTSVSGYANAVGTAARFNSPRYLTMNISETSIFVTDTSNHAVRRIDYPSGVTTTFAGAATPIAGFTTGTGTTARFNNPRGIVRYYNDYLFVTDSGNNGIRQITTGATVTNWTPNTNVAGFAVNTGATTARFNAPEGIAWIYDTTVARFGFYLTDTGNHTLRRVRDDAFSYTNFVGSIAPTPGAGASDGSGTVAKVNGPKGVAIDSNGNIYIADTGNHTIRKVTLLGVVTTIAGSPGTSGYADGVGSTARFSSPAGIAVGPGNVLYVTDTGNCAVRKIVMNDLGTYGTVSTYAGSVPPTAVCGYTNASRLNSRFQNPVGLYVMGNGNILVTDTGNHAIRLITP